MRSCWILQNPDWKDVYNWNGSNYLGIILMEVREELREEARAMGFVQYIDFRDAAPIPEWSTTVIYLKRFPQYYSAIHAYADQLPVGHTRDSFYRCTFEAAELMMRENMGGGLPIAGFYEMKQKICLRHIQRGAKTVGTSGRSILLERSRIGICI